MRYYFVATYYYPDPSEHFTRSRWATKRFSDVGWFSIAALALDEAPVGATLLSINRYRE